MGEKRDTRIALLVVLPIVAALIAGLVVYAATATLVDSTRLERDAALERIEELEVEVDELRALLAEETDAEQPDNGTSANGAGSEPATKDEAQATADGRYFCYVRDVKNEAGTTEITVDFAELLTGDAAAAAATAAGEESPPPNDYFIRNVNPLLRTFPVQAGIDVELHHTDIGVDTSGYSVVLDQWHDFFIGMSPGMEVLREVPYWIEVVDGTVTAIEEQYLP